MELDLNALQQLPADEELAGGLCSLTCLYSCGGGTCPSTCEKSCLYSAS